MTFEPKPITREGIPTALRKADRYRLINDPSSAESICRDVLLIEPRSQEALVTLLLAITDQFGEAPTEGVRRAQALLPDLEDDYERAYYAGIICERCAKAQLRSNSPGSGAMAYDWLREAMDWYEDAEARRAPGNDESILRWNTCARLLARYPQLKPRVDEPVQLGLE